jgi:hypothetical protein
VRLASFDESFAPYDKTTLKKLRDKHSPAHSASTYPQPQATQEVLQVTPSIVKKSIFPFPSGSAAGPDGLHPQYLKDLITFPANDSTNCLLEALTIFVKLVMSGGTPMWARPFFFGANLIGLNKSDGGVRPIAIGNTLRRLVSKCAGLLIKCDMASLLSPLQLGYGTPRGAEIVVHSARRYLSSLDIDHVMFKLDFRNAFNSIRRDRMLHCVRERAPGIFPLVFSAYRHPSFLFFGGSIIESAEGVQQGDPLGPLLFCLTIHKYVEALKSEFKVFYIDDGTLGGTPDQVKEDLCLLDEAAREINLSLNMAKCEIISTDVLASSPLVSAYPSLACTSSSDVILLGSPIGSSAQCMDAVLQTKIDNLRTLGGRLELLHAHDALCLLRHAFSVPKVLHVLRTAPCFGSSLLSVFDNVQRSFLEMICNVRLSDQAWLQASLPVSSGGLGIRSLVTLAPSAFLASFEGSIGVSNLILPPRVLSIGYQHSEDALQVWRRRHSGDAPTGTDASRQKAWDGPVVEAQLISLYSDVTPKSKARLHAAQRKESGAWLNAPPISSLGLRLEDTVVTTAVGLRLGSPLCVPHRCQHCGAEVDESGTHGLSCRRSEGRHPRHSALNNLVKRALAAVNVPAVLEPRGLCPNNDSRPDGISLIPWSRGKALVWDATVHDTFARSNINLTCHGAGLYWLTKQPAAREEFTSS